MNALSRNKHAKLPFVFSNFAITADGKIAFAGGEFVPFGSERDREHMMELRAAADAVMAGARTIEMAGATLGTGGKKYERMRVARGLNQTHLRVIVSNSGSINPDAEIFKRRFSPIIVLTSKRIPEKRFDLLRGVADAVGVFGQNELDLQQALRWLLEKWKVKRLLCEGGGTLHEAMIRAELIDELHLTICPTIFGGCTAPTIADGEGFGNLAKAAKFKLKALKRAGNELFVVFKAAKIA